MITLGEFPLAAYLCKLIFEITYPNPLHGDPQIAHFHAGSADRAWPRSTAQWREREPRRDALEFRLQVGIAAPLVARQGYRSEEVVAALSRAWELNETLGDGPQSFNALRALYELFMGRSDYARTFELCDKLELVAQRDRDPYLAAQALWLRGISGLFLGRLRESQTVLTEAIDVFSREKDGSKVLAPDDPGVSSAVTLSLVLWMLGYPEQALHWTQEALNRANALGAQFSIAIAHCFRAILMRFLGDNVATLEEADKAIAICDKFGFGYWGAQALLERGWAIAMQGRGSEGKSFELRAAMSLHRLWSEKGKRAEARRIVAEVYHRFSEGFDTRDLVDAQRMLRNG